MVDWKKYYDEHLISMEEAAAKIQSGDTIWMGSTLCIPYAFMDCLADRVDVSASCSLLHVPLDAAAERDIDPQILRWLAFAEQKTAEIATLAKGLTLGTDAIAGELSANRADLASRAGSPLTHDPAVRARAAAVTEADARRSQSYTERTAAQRARVGLPRPPTRTIGAFPQTGELRTARAYLQAGRMDTAGYEERIKAEIREVIGFQEKAGLDVLVHGEAERNDMVEYFGEQLEGYAFSQFGWVQSYGSRCVKPPILFGDIARPQAMTVEWIAYAQSLTAKPMKGMLTGPVTILNWSFVRDDQPRATTCKQLALAIRQEVLDLEKAGVRVIQIDEAALREGLPLRKSQPPCEATSAIGRSAATRLPV